MRFSVDILLLGDTKLTDLINFKLGSELDTVWTWVLQSGWVQKKCAPPPPRESKFIFQPNNFFSGNAFADLISPNTRNAKFLGVRTLLYSSAETSQAKLSNWTGLDSAKPIRTYHSTERELILKLCGWDKKKMGKKNLNEISRNAAIAVFNLDMKAAIEILKSGCTGSKGVRFLFCSLLLIFYEFCMFLTLSCIAGWQRFVK